MPRILPNIQWNLKSVANAVNVVNAQTTFMGDVKAPIPTALNHQSIGATFNIIRIASGCPLPRIMAYQEDVNNALNLLEICLEEAESPP